MPTTIPISADASVLAEGSVRTEANLLAQRIQGSLPAGQPGPWILPVLNKSDVPGVRPAKDMLAISARSGMGLEELKKAFITHVEQLRQGPGDIVVTNARHVDALTKARSALQDARAAIDNGTSGELFAIDLRRAQHHLGEITGRITTDDLLGSIFGRFCIGK